MQCNKWSIFLCFFPKKYFRTGWSTDTGKWEKGRSFSLTQSCIRFLFGTSSTIHQLKKPPNLSIKDQSEHIFSFLKHRKWPILTNTLHKKILSRICLTSPQIILPYEIRAPYYVWFYSFWCAVIFLPHAVGHAVGLAIQPFCYWLGTDRSCFHNLFWRLSHLYFYFCFPAYLDFSKYLQAPYQ